MDITLKAKNFKLTAEMEDHIRRRVERLPRYLDGVESAEVLLSQEPTRLTPQRFHYVIQLTLRTRNNLIRSEVANPELLTGVDEALSNISRQIERHKTRASRKRKGAPSLGKSAEMLASPLPELPSVAEMAAPAEAEEEIPAAVSSVSGNGAHDDEVGSVVRVKRFGVEPMFAEDAIEQMELLGHSFFVFWNAEDDCMSVVYRRKDGNYGVLEPQLK